VQAQPETTIASLQTRVVLQAWACVTLPYHRTSALELAHSTGCRIHADQCILRVPAMLRGAEAGVGAAGGECFVADRCRELALRDGHPYGVAVMQSEHDGLVLGACVCTVLSHLAVVAGPLALARLAVGCARCSLCVVYVRLNPYTALPRCAACCTAAHAASGRRSDGAHMPAYQPRRMPPLSIRRLVPWPTSPTGRTGRGLGGNSSLGANQRDGRNFGEGRLRTNGLAGEQATLASGRRSEEPGDIEVRCLLVVRTGVS
jgi:hypothetical protein